MNATQIPNPLSNRVLARAHATEVRGACCSNLTNKGPVSDLDFAIRDL